MSESASIAFTGAIALHDLAEARTRLSAALAQHDQVIVDVSALDTPGLPVVQLLAVARESAVRADKSLRLSAPAAGDLLEVVRRGGFIEGASDEQRQFWLGDAA